MAIFDLGVRIGDTETNQEFFLETEERPQSVVVRSQRTRALGNPIALFFKQLTKQPAGDAAALAEATWDNRIVALRPSTGVNIPALPIAILLGNPADHRTDTWAIQIEKKMGTDRYSIDAETGKVIEEPDGIPEIELKTMDVGKDPAKANLQLLDLGNKLKVGEVNRQIANGITSGDLKEFNGELRWNKRTMKFEGQAVITGDVRSQFESVIGKQRICFLYTSAEPFGHAGFNNVVCLRPVCGRVMAVENPKDEETILIFQPTVMISRTAVSVDIPNWSHEGDHFSNPYLYNLKLTN